MLLNDVGWNMKVKETFRFKNEDSYKDKTRLNFFCLILQKKGTRERFILLFSLEKLKLFIFIAGGQAPL